ncbi:ABC transporter substrate-binding protein [Lampropedia aestuarii]|uniref:ABC transporter substrate-binding protein n=1 Tax=Lampropedia aestuarii TaxID=2562762 RepID=A0A4S5BRU2_9BURK|nr:tripartite tricarboxylate transporter substrate-binding protein [Lampropedia aestuarii]MDH5858028.1 tripartite tricarboxylate transporter substrate-binding protein [Lampropedia aestuarii]THJ33675.1 ABC transporter substrate-binding protein [Lampropedia aestuarii]
MRCRSLTWSLTAAVALLAAPLLQAAESGKAGIDSPVSIIVGYPAGGASDRAARLLADALNAKLGVPVIVENKPGAGGRVAAQQFKSTPVDKNALILANPAVMVVAPLVFKDVGYDVDKDFIPVSHLTNYDFAVAVAPTLPVTDLQGLMTWLKDNPQQANVGVPATGSLPHFFALMLGDKAGVQSEVIGYNGSAPLTSDLLGGQIPVAVDTEDALLPQFLGGKLRILATSGNARSVWAEQVPSFKEAGLELEASGWNTLYAPASTPTARIEALAQAVHEVMQEPALRQRFIDSKITPVGSTQAQTRETLAAFEQQWAPVVKNSGYQP